MDQESQSQTAEAPGSDARHCSTARQVVDFQRRVREMIAVMNDAFPVGSKVVCDVVRGVKRYRIVGVVSRHQFSDGERMTSGLNVELEDWQVEALNLHPMLVHKICGKNVLEVPWSCVAVYAAESIHLSQ